MATDVGWSRRAPTEAPDQRHLPGEAGTWVFIMGDLTVFFVFFLVYLLTRARSPELFAAAQQALDPRFGAVYTVLLLLGSWFVVAALGAECRRARPFGAGPVGRRGVRRG